jgi:hypothetical protein
MHATIKAIIIEASIIKMITIWRSVIVIIKVIAVKEPPVERRRGPNQSKTKTIRSGI